MRKLYIILFTFIIGTAFAAPMDDKSIITPDLQEFMAQKSNDDLIRINIRMAERMDQSTRHDYLKKLPLEERRQEVISQLKQFSAETQSDLMTFLNQQPSADFKVEHQFWISNVITAMASESLIQELALRSDIDRIDIDETRILISEMPEPIPFDPTDKGVDEITYNIIKVNADDVWAAGYTGEGIIVSVIDAGVNYNHVDLADHMWESTDFPNHGYDFRNDDNDPMDGHGHGTHCAGTVAGDGTAGSQTGMAPDALIMACKVLGDDGSGEESYVWEAMEFTVEQGAHIISMSLGWSHSWNPDRETWRNAMNNVMAAGVVASVAAGNEGGSTNDIDDVRTPGDCPPPWLHPEQTLIGGISAVVCVGATNSSDGAAGFSSRGPSSWEGIQPFDDYPHNPELGLLRPDVSAPGVDIKSTDAFNPNGYTMMSGTSMATPGVAGVMALLMSKNPGLSPEDICMILETTSVDLGTVGKDNVYGTGRIDAFEALENTSEQGPTYEAHTLTDDNSNGEVEAGESIVLSVTMYNGSDMAFDNVDVTITCESSYITMTDEQENYGTFAIDEAVTVADGFSFDVAANMPGLETLRFNVAATDGNEVWSSYFEITSWGPQIFIGLLTIDDAAGNDNGRLDPGEEATLIIDVHNGGQAPIEDLNLQLTYAGNYIEFESLAYSFDALAGEEVDQASFNITVDADAPIGSVELLASELTAEPFSNSRDFYLTIGLILEDWETGDFTMFDWAGDWIVSDEDPYEGLYCSKSASIGDAQQTTLVIDYEVGSDDLISFYKKVSSESGYDYLKFYIDNAEMGAWSGEEAWSMAEFDVTAGLHTFKWEYSKDGSVSGGADAAWVDYIILPPMALPSIVMETEAGVCDDQTYTSDAVAENYESLLWTSTGDGSFDDETMAGATYTAGANDMMNGIVYLTLTASGANGDVSSTVDLEIYATSLMAPDMPTGMANLCLNPVDQVYKTNMAVGNELTWMLDPAEAGVLMADYDSVSIQWTEGYFGEANLSVMTANPCAESAYSSALLISVFDNPEVIVDEFYGACEGTEVEVDLILNGYAPWTLTVEGAEDIITSDHNTTLSWTVDQDSSMTILMVTDANGCYNDTPQNIEVLAFENPMVDLGVDTSVCVNHQVVLDAGNPGATYTWSTSESTQSITVDSTGMNAANEKLVTVMVMTHEFDCETEDQILITFEDCAGIGELTTVNEVSVYPNPNNGRFEIAIESKQNQGLELEVLNIQGQVLYTEQIELKSGAQKHQLDLSDYPAQTYLLILRSDQGQIVNRFIIE